MSALEDLPGRVLAFADAQPGLVAVVVLVLVVAVVGPLLRPSPSRGDCDPQRLFTPAQRHEGFARAQGRCEHVGSFGLRCSARPTHGDHVYPWSRGGATAMDNYQALCAVHNLRKGAKVPSAFYMWRLARRRRRYFPPGVPTRVEWRIGLSR
ncbi:HNH endonuclease [Oerskovia sp. NPDC060338]|uniref:HNH endonuclease n=1 Tax=Oerskovia sp. NPDC060338 TaxID=3347100 RepID=UPI00364BC393